MPLRASIDTPGLTPARRVEPCRERSTAVNGGQPTGLQSPLSQAPASAWPTRGSFSGVVQGGQTNVTLLGMVQILRPFIVVAILGVAVSAQQGPQESDFLSRVRRLTVDGLRAGEGYWAPDGQRLVFQSEREPGNPFYQIYTLDFGTGDTSRISPGHGKTTCAFFRPDSDQILFASTHHDPESRSLQQAELDFRASGQERRYAWDYDAEFDIYAASEGSGEFTRLTDSRGYDAEASYSPDGEWIVFSSMRDAYNRTLTAPEQRQLDIDPSYFAEIYIMRADGSDERRLTDVIGYDGGPFFSPDGTHIVWRRFDAQGLIADVWTMKPDGTDARQITDFAAMSWAPYIHPSGEYVLFASNKLGFENFEVFMVDIEGMKEPVRVTYSDGFDGLPVPSPDGNRLAWTSSRGGGRAGQLYLADWNHDGALTALRAAPNR
jgi:Tol biopolymer transport system component